MNETTRESPAPAACERVRTRLDRLLDGGLGALDEARDLGHLEACAGCATARERYETWMTSVVGDLTARPADLAAARLGLEARWSARAPSPVTPMRRLARSRAVQAVVAAAAAFALLFALDGGRVLEGLTSEAWVEAYSVLEDWQRELRVPDLGLEER